MGTQRNWPTAPGGFVSTHKGFPIYKGLPDKPYAVFSAPRDDTARASCGNGAKRKILSLFSVLLPAGKFPEDKVQRI